MGADQKIVFPDTVTQFPLPDEIRLCRSGKKPPATDDIGRSDAIAIRITGIGWLVRPAQIGLYDLIGKMVGTVDTVIKNVITIGFVRAQTTFGEQVIGDDAVGAACI